MSRMPSVGRALWGTVVGGLLIGPLCIAAETSSPPIVVRSHAAADGQTYLAFSLRWQDAPRQPLPHDHVVLVDTSASQVGEHRTQSFAVLREMLASLPANDRVAVFAVDLEAEAITSGLVSPAEAIQTALPQLQRRVPAGSTDMAAVLQTALQQFSGRRPASIVYIGDGMSTGRLLQPHELRSLISELRRREIPVHSFAVGSNTDLQLLGTLAQQTGGVVILDQPGGKEFGLRLARAIDLPVVYPTEIRVADGIELLPHEPLPLRSDRETVYLGRGKTAPNARIEMTATIDARRRELSWNIPPARLQQANEFLFPLWVKAEQSNGLTNGLAGDELVAVAQQAFVDVIDALEASAEEARARGNLEEAERIGRLLESANPTSVHADAARQSASAAAPATVAQAENQPAPPAPATLQERERPREADLLLQAEELERIRTQRLQTEVNATLNSARQILPSEPEIARNLLEDALRTVKAATDVDPDAKNQLIRLLNNELASVNNQITVIQANRREAQRRVAVQQAQARLLDAQLQYDLRTRELVDRVRALMVEAYEGNANAFEEAEAVSRIIANMRPGSAIGTQTVFMTEAAGQLDKANRLRLLRSDRFLETLYQVELSHVPFPDEPPIRYPPAEVWQALTEKRRKWESVDLHQNSPNEARIYEALDSATTIEFTGTPLREVIDYIKELHDIPILLDQVELSTVGITGEEEVNLIVSGIKLRSALQLILESVAPEPLAWVIDNEVMQITTKEKAEETLQTRVYPVADLVIPIRVVGGGFGAGGFGGGGVFGGGMGGMGMGGMGMGGMGMGGMGMGGMGGMGMGGFGGGFFSVPDPEQTAQPAAQPQPRVFDASTIEQLKKKPAHAK